MSRPADLSRAATQASRVLLARRVDALPVDPLALLKACRNTDVCTLEAALEETGPLRAQVEGAVWDADAFTCTCKQGGELHYIIVYRTDGNPARLRFSLAHELGHRILRHTGNDPVEEREADCFASFLLCPEPVLRLLASLPGEAVERIVTICYVSRSCARVSLRRPPFLIDPVVMAALKKQLAPLLEDLEQTLLKSE